MKCNWQNWQCIYPLMTMREIAMADLLAIARNHYQWAKSWNDKWEHKERIDYLRDDWRTTPIDDFDRDNTGTRRDPDWNYMIKELDYQTLYEPTAAACRAEVVRASLAMHVVELLEDVPERDKNWRLLSDQMVLELVDPSLYPIVYGRTRVLPEGTRASLANWKEHLGGGIPAVARPASLLKDRCISRKYVSDRFQLLPADFVVDTNGKVKIQSYINTLDPGTHRAPYPLLAPVFEHAVPLLERVLGRLQKVMPLRITPSPKIGLPPRMADWKDPLVPAPPADYDHACNAYTPYPLRGRTLKVITRLTSMHVSPTGDSPLFRGEWRVAGKANETICGAQD
ncbi:hypothetical protein AMAG_18867 [Allomyces macrogynus ATCC 38327]|uniref:DUF4246 domain-containing protein n=1 Tax=Allomyces macrogynus (strain ATCC 38327) TaxID=578462 RepID=A0A0L0SIY0_ALLM3|nr:hypothetical protein AMAG_18867 [Allomyces macrogynus ATCC 38327]|eukprot:KNE62447.1 hypothetical protein AMAG_18867 [Allomyces macrogynus ATCC 38327]